MARTRKDLEQSLKKGEIESVYLLYGSETYLRDQAVSAIAEAALEGTLLREFNDSTFDLTTDKISAAIAAADRRAGIPQHRRRASFRAVRRAVPDQIGKCSGARTLPADRHDDGIGLRDKR